MSSSKFVLTFYKHLITMSSESSCSRYSTYSRYSSWQYYEIQNNVCNIWNLLFQLSLITFRYSLKSLAFFNSFYRHHRPNMWSKFCNISFHDQLTTIVSGVSGRTKPVVISHGQILLGVLGASKPFELIYMLLRYFF